MRKNCQSYPECLFVRIQAKKTDFNKIALFTAFTKHLDSCLWSIARRCNSRTENILGSCKDDKAGMWLQADYPNHPGPSGKTIVETAYDENLRKSKGMHR